MTLFIIYFAHCTADYNTEYEKLCIDKIKNDYPDSVIINPADISKNIDAEQDGDFWSIEKNYFFPEIDKSDIVVIVKCWNDRSWRGRYTPGVIAEIKYARDLGKKILEFGE